VRRYRPVLLIASVAVLAGACASASSAKVQVGPVKGATYVGVVHDTDVTIKVSANAKTATARMLSIPGYCQGGSGPETAHPQPASIRGGELKETIAFTSAGSNKPFATAVIEGTFIGKDFDGQEKSTFKNSKACNGRESFEATTSK
jgi:hypothetical protein